MKNPKRAEGLWRKVQDRIFVGQYTDGNISAVESARIPVDIRRFPWIRKLAADYAFSFPSLAPFYAGDPAEPSSWSAAISRAQRHPRERAQLTQIIRAQHARRDAPPAARAAADLLSDSHTVAIVTGQQAGL